MLLKLVYILLYFIFFVNANAIVEPRQASGNRRFKLFSYNPDDVYKYTGYYMHNCSINFEPGEEIQTVSLDDPTGWIFDFKGNTLLLKPISETANTSGFIQTNKRIYYIEFYVKESKGAFDPDVPLKIDFQYPTASTDNGLSDTIITFNQTEMPDFSKIDQYNFNYTTSGSNNITPKKAFDDGKRLFLEFKDIVPIITGVDSDGYEQIVNTVVLGPYSVVDTVPDILTLRYGPDTVCVFNEQKKRK